MSYFSDLNNLITEAIEMGIGEYNIIDLMIDEGIPSEAAPIILDQFIKSKGSYPLGAE
jgi:hypothetical protein